MSERTQVSYQEAQSSEIECGSFTSAQTVCAAETKLVVVSFNIRYGVGSHLISGSVLRRAGLARPKRRRRLVARHIKQAARAFRDEKLLPRAAIIALQEADRETVRAGGAHVARELACELGMNYAHAALNLPRDETPKAKQWYLDFEERILPGDAGETGIATLALLPFSRVERVDLPWADCAWRPRLALFTQFKFGAQEINVFNSHIDPHASMREQLDQHTAILERAAQVKGPTMLLGDFNTLSARACREMHRLLESHSFTTPFSLRTKTWRGAALVRLHTDWIFVRGAHVSRFGVAKPLGVSDHWPVWVELDFGARGL